MSEEQTIKQTLKDKYMGRIVRVRTLNNRVFQGKLVSIDFRCNIILIDAIAEIMPQHNTPLNYSLDNTADMKLQFKPNPDLSFEQQQQQRKQYFGTHYHFGSIMVAGNDIKKIQMKFQSQDKVKQESQQEVSAQS